MCDPLVVERSVYGRVATACAPRGVENPPRVRVPKGTSLVGVLGGLCHIHTSAARISLHRTNSRSRGSTKTSARHSSTILDCGHPHHSSDTKDMCHTVQRSQLVSQLGVSDLKTNSMIPWRDIMSCHRITRSFLITMYNCRFCFKDDI